MAVPQQCSAFLIRHDGLLQAAHSCNATYLFQKDKFYETKYDTGDKHIQCGRRADVLKFWFMWRAKGTDGLEDHINKLFTNADFFTHQIKTRPGFELFLDQPECTNICFWYIPPSLQKRERNQEYMKLLHKVAPKIKERMMKEGNMMITYQPLGNHPNLFRLVLQNSALNEDDMIHFIDEIERLGRDL